MQVGGRRPLARARTGAGVGPAGHTFWHRECSFSQGFKGNLLPPLGEANLLVLQANLAIRVGLKGDINDDSIIDILDVVISINYVLDGVSPELNIFWAADMNFDNTLNILDVVRIINIILN